MNGLVIKPWDFVTWGQKLGWVPDGPLSPYPGFSNCSGTFALSHCEITRSWCSHREEGDGCDFVTCHQLWDITNFSCSGDPRGALSVSCHRVQHYSFPVLGRNLQHWSQTRKRSRIELGLLWLMINKWKHDSSRKSCGYHIYLVTWFLFILFFFMEDLISPAHSCAFVQAWWIARSWSR